MLVIMNALSTPSYIFPMARWNGQCNGPNVPMVILHQCLCLTRFVFDTLSVTLKIASHNAMAVCPLLLALPAPVSRGRTVSLCLVCQSCWFLRKMKYGSLMELRNVAANAGVF